MPVNSENDPILPDTLPAASLCGFKLPALPNLLKLLLPIFPKIPLPPLPSFAFSIGLNCSLTNPLSVSAGVPWGGGRTRSGLPESGQGP